MDDMIFALWASLRAAEGVRQVIVGEKGVVKAAMRLLCVRFVGQ